MSRPIKSSPENTVKESFNPDLSRTIIRSDRRSCPQYWVLKEKLMTELQAEFGDHVSVFDSPYQLHLPNRPTTTTSHGPDGNPWTDLTDPGGTERKIHDRLVSKFVDKLVEYQEVWPKLFASIWRNCDLGCKALIAECKIRSS